MALAPSEPRERLPQVVTGAWQQLYGSATGVVTHGGAVDATVLRAAFRRLKGAGPLAASQVLAKVFEAGAVTAARAAKLEKGEWRQVGCVGRPRKWGRRQHADGDAAARSIRTMAGGQVSEAIDIIAADGVVRASKAEAVAEVARLFPQAVGEVPKVGVQALLGAGGRSLVRETAAGDNEAAWLQAVREAVLDAPRGAAPGVSGMRSGWVRDAVLGDGGREALGVVASWVEGLLTGGKPELLRTVRLSLLSKGEKGGWRPLGVGEAVGNVAKRVALRVLQPLAEERFGVEAQWLAADDGCRRWGSHMQDMWERGHCLVSVDVRNAFNCVDRAVVVDCVREVCPQLAPFVTWCLQPTTLVVGEATHSVSRGVVQGDPLSPALFGLVMCRVMTRVVSQCRDRGVHVQLLGPHDDVDDTIEGMAASSVAMGAYADDCFFAFRDVSCAAVVATVLEEEFGRVGLELARAKTCVVPGRGCALADAAIRGWDGVESSPACVVLGVPVGEPAAARALLLRRVDKAVRRLKSVWALGRPCAEATALQQCSLSASVTWAMEACGPGVVDEDVLRAISTAEEELHRHALGVYGERASPGTHLRVAARSVVSGGMGWTRVEDVGMVDGDTNRWRARTKEERAAWEEEKWAEAIRLAGEGTALKRRLLERKVVAAPARRGKKPPPVMWAWWASSVALRGMARGEGVEAIALAMALGVPVVTREGPCPLGHGGNRVAERTHVADGWSLHPESCAVGVQHQRHNCAQDQLFYEVKRVLAETAKEVSKEKGIGPDGNIVERRNAEGERIFGDIYILDEHGNRVFVDVGWQGVALKGVRGRNVVGRLAGDEVFERKLKQWCALWSDLRVAPRGRFVPLAISTVGRVALRSVEDPLLRRLPGLGWGRVVAAGLLAQATAAASIVAQLNAGGAVVGIAVPVVVDGDSGDDDSDDGSDGGGSGSEAGCDEDGGGGVVVDGESDSDASDVGGDEENDGGEGGEEAVRASSCASDGDGSDSGGWDGAYECVDGEEGDDVPAGVHARA
jgi:hypothetical protein